MSATSDVNAYLKAMKPEPGQTVEDFAREGLRWQTEIYSSNAGHDIQGLGWGDITEESREGWREWARKKGAVDPHAPEPAPTSEREPHPR